jgi:hypothetical protein
VLAPVKSAAITERPTINSDLLPKSENNFKTWNFLTASKPDKCAALRVQRWRAISAMLQPSAKPLIQLLQTGLFLCKKNTRLKNLFDAAWKFNGRANLRHCKPLQGNGSATIFARIRCLLQTSPATGSATSYAYYLKRNVRQR